MNKLILAFLLLFSISGYCQKVGVVLSGGGAKGIAHVGFLKALEENNVPIDFIAGTSAGALVGGLYACGYSPDQLKMLLTSEEFKNMALGKIEEDFMYYFKKSELDASWGSFKLSSTTKLAESLPTNIINPVALDFQSMEMMAGAEVASNYNFDSLYIPFRCVASDIAKSQPIIFKSGRISDAVRASASYPFYLKPIKVNGKVLMDGGLYNNFPADVMYEDFFPDVILGCRVASNAREPNEDDILLQIENMLMNETDFSVICENGVLVEPDIGDLGIFDFDRAYEAYSSGYMATYEKLKEIKRSVPFEISPEERAKKRGQFNAKKPELIFENFEIEGLKKSQANYIKQSLKTKNDTINVKRLKKPYFRLFADDKISFIYPTAIYNPKSEYFDLKLRVKKERDIIIGVGGNFSSRPINTAFISAKYNYLDNIAVSLMANSYFGKLYGSTQVRARIDFPIDIPFFIEPEFTLNRWDYFKSKATFFEDVKPSFLVQYENFGGIKIGVPLQSKGKIKLGYNFGELRDSYYQTKNFISTDTTDKTTFTINSPFLYYERSTLNKKQYADKGTYLKISLRGVLGEEFHEPGSTSDFNRNYSKFHEWVKFQVTYDNYYKKKGIFRLGLYLDGVFSTQNPFNNYTASILQAPAFSPIPESKTLFLETFRAYKYAAVGHKLLIHAFNSFDVRLEGYLFQPYRTINKTEDNLVEMGDPFEQRFTMAMAALVYKSPLGPLSFSTNYYHNIPEVVQGDRTPLTFLFHFGYILFNKRALN
ncbi:MAG: patatin-like phospholipase family protein [Flavobacteriales bacterium]|nr:patatin-like phospholipase family protein [Flavobacteriales bacterium]